METFDVIIVGSGPAGVSTALNIHRINPELAGRTLVLEKAKHPREKICAGGLVRNAEILLDELGISIDVPYVAVNTVRFKYGKGVLDIYEKGLSKIIRRDEFDAKLAKTVVNRGILREGEEVTDLSRDRDCITVATKSSKYKAKVVVGADGVTSIVRRKMGFPAGRKPTPFCLIETPVDANQTPEFIYKMFTFDFTYIQEGLQGYVWDFPCIINGRTHLNRGITDRSLSPKVNLHEIFKKALSKRGVNLDEYKLKAHPKREFDPNGIFSAPNVLLVGDAAGIDPLVGEGVPEALEYGKIAANEIVESFEKDIFSFKNYKRKIFSSRLGKELKMYVIFSNMLYGPRFEFTFSLLWNDAHLQRLLVHSFMRLDNFYDNKLRLMGKLLKHLFESKKLPKIEY